MITTAELKSQTKAELAQMAEDLGIQGAGRLRKADLISELTKAAKAKPSATARSSSRQGSSRKQASTNKAKTTAKATASKASSSSTSGGKTPASPRSKASRRTAAKAANGTVSAKSNVAVAKNTKSAARERSGATARKTAKAAKLAKGAPAAKVKAGPKSIKAGGKSSAKSNAPKSSSRKNSSSKSGSAKKQVAQKGPAKTTVTAKESVRKGSPTANKGGNPQDKSTSPKPKKLVASKPQPKRKRKPKPTNTSPAVLKRIRELQLQKGSNKDISFRPTLVRPPGATEPIWEKEPQKDRIGLFVRDAFWMHASWDVTRAAIERAKASMAEQWHSARPILRLLRLDDSGTTSTSETVERDIDIHGGIRNWYIDWTGEAARFRVLIGYLAPNDRFHAIAKSNIVRTPEASSTDAVDAHWADSAPESEKIFALSGGYDGEQETADLKDMLEERLQRNLGAPALARLGASAEGPYRRRGDFHFDMEIELVIYGSTVPDGYLTLSGEPVALRPDGTFVLRLPFPDRRQVLPAVACSRDGGQQRTIVVAVERNTKIMEPLETEKDTGE